jgi:succinate-semialdehyde dehydrogenase/glutarate-semialdehyde dehydrogenase
MTDATSDTRELTVREPDTGDVIGRVPVLGPDEVRAQARRGREAGRGWRETPLETRCRHLRRLRRLVVEEIDDVAATVARETGKTQVDVHLGEILPACDHLAWAEKHAPDVLGERRLRSLGPGTHRGRVSWEPYGLAGAITPWNFPFAITVGALGSALAAGNAVLLKPSELTPYSSLRLKTLADRALPDPDLVQVATGDGTTGQAVVNAPVDVLSFTGSVATGRKVMEAAARHLTPVVLELGGKDVMIVLDDADLERAARGAVWGGFFHAGQICQSVERVLVQRDVHDRFVERVVEETRRLHLGPRAEGPDVGALTRPDQVEVVSSHVEDARERGARVLTGGRRREGPGSFYEPTVLTGITPEMTIWREETFGPVLPVMAFETDDEAVRLADETRFGLDAYVWSGDRERARSLARRLDVGSVMINDCITNYALPELPFGGVNDSGFGRTHGEEGLRSFARARSEAEPRLKLSREPHWFPGADQASRARALVRLLHGEGVTERVRAAWDALRGEGDGAPAADAEPGDGRGAEEGSATPRAPAEAESTAVGADRRTRRNTRS